MVVVSVRTANTLHILLQRGESALCPRKVSCLQRTLECLEIVGQRIALDTASGGGSVCWRKVLCVLLPFGEGLLGCSQITGLQGAAQALEILKPPADVVLRGGLVH